MDASNLTTSVHHLTMRASEELGEMHDTGAAHASLALMEQASNAMAQAVRAARYARHALEYPRKQSPEGDQP